MNKQEAKQLLSVKLEEYRALSYSELVARLDDIDCFEVTGPTGVEYQIEVQFMWDSKPGGDVRVLAGIDDGRWSAFCPLCADFVVSPDGQVFGE